MSAARVRRTLGIVVLVAGVVAAIAMWFGAGRRYDDAVGKLAPAPIGCNTTLVFDKTGTYTFFVETHGQIGRIEGDCQSDARTYEVDGVPRVTLTLVDDDGDNVDLDRTSGPTYDRDGKQGTGVRSVDIDRTGTYVLSATADDDTEAVIRVGRDPAAGVAALRVGAVIALVVGVVGGVLLLVLRPRPSRVLAPPVIQPPWPTGLPTRPPAGPPNANPPVPPPYAPRPPSVRPPSQPAGQPPWYQPPQRPPGAPVTEPPPSAWPPPSSPPDR
jgi:hypothetical protein